MPKRLTTEEFRIQLSKEHPELELLSEYNGNKNYVTVRCKIHDYEFKTKPNWLHHGASCQKCYDDRRGKTLLKTTEQFLEEIKDIYKDKNYDFSKVDYKGNKRKVTVICPIHGEFQATPNKMLTRGDGCKKCGDAQNGFNKRLTKEEFIRKAREIHGWKYDYSKVEYITSDTKVCIICPEHGEFWQAPYNHLIGHGCSKCNESHLEREIRNLLLALNVDFEFQKKFEWMGQKSLDFYIPSKNIGIECQGLQHFIPVEHYGDIEGFDKRVLNDITKYTLCQDHNIKMIYIADDVNFPKNCNDNKFNGIYKDIHKLSEIKESLKNYLQYEENTD